MRGIFAVDYPARLVANYTPVGAKKHSVASLALMEAVHADYREHDLFVRFPDGTVTRPQVCMFHDLRSSMMLS